MGFQIRQNLNRGRRAGNINFLCPEDSFYGKRVLEDDLEKFPHIYHHAQGEDITQGKGKEGRAKGRKSLEFACSKPQRKSLCASAAASSLPSFLPSSAALSPFLWLWPPTPPSRLSSAAGREGGRRRLLGWSVHVRRMGQQLRRWFGQVQPATGWQAGRREREIDLGPLQGGANRGQNGLLKYNHLKRHNCGKKGYRLENTKPAP